MGKGLSNYMFTQLCGFYEALMSHHRPQAIKTLLLQLYKIINFIEL